MKKVLWLASWYPNKMDPYTGDFVERHARAASLFSQIELFYVVKDRSPFPSKKIVEEKKKFPEGLETSIIYYRTPAFSFSWLEKLYSNYQYWNIHKNYFKEYLVKNGKPDGIHVHIALKSGMIALYLKFRYGIKYVVSEHWSGLCPEAKPNFNEKPFLTRVLWKWVMKHASGFSAVSAYLSTIIENKFSLKKGAIIPNVVDSQIFYPSLQKFDNAQFIHISSTNNYQKNIITVLEATAIVINHLPQFKLVIFGQPGELEKNYVRTMKLDHAVEFKDMSPQNILREYLQKSVALILYSKFETFGCVIIEANACGIPVIVSDIPVFHENVKAGLTGAFVPLDKPKILADTIITVAAGKYYFDPEQIQNWALTHYSFEKIGKQFASFYNDNFI